jgi:hypothetical protein
VSGAGRPADAGARCRLRAELKGKSARLIPRWCRPVCMAPWPASPRSAWRVWL